MRSSLILRAGMRAVTTKNPVVHCITNYVTVHEVAQVLLAAGASPVMADDLDDAREMTGIVDALLLNIGTLNQRTLATMHECLRQAATRGIPVVLDPVGVGATTVRTEAALALLARGGITCIKGNISEIKALLHAVQAQAVDADAPRTRGVDAHVDDLASQDVVAQAEEYARAAAQQFGCIVVVTGAVDVVSDGEVLWHNNLGSPLQAQITGAGCMLGAVIAAYLASCLPGSGMHAVQAALLHVTRAAMLAEDACRDYPGNATYNMALINWVQNLRDQKLTSQLELEQNLRLYAVTPPGISDMAALVSQVAQVIEGGATMVQLREKIEPHIVIDLGFSHEDLCTNQALWSNPEHQVLYTIYQRALALRKLTFDHGVPLIINDYPALARAVCADGVHVGQDDFSCREARAYLGESFIIGVSAHTAQEAEAAEADGADYLGAGAVFATQSKADAKAVSVEVLTEIVQAVSLPVIAIGGIDAHNAHSLTTTGIAGIAVISALFSVPDPREAAIALREIVGALDDDADPKHGHLVYQEMTAAQQAANTHLPCPSHAVGVLTIAGSDSSGGAGIQADLKTMAALGTYGMSVITALTAQNTQGVQNVMGVPVDFVSDQIDSVMADIMPSAIKIGMIADPAIARLLGKRLAGFAGPIVVDPVMVATSGATLSSQAAIDALVSEVFPYATLITPNLPEASILFGNLITTIDEMKEAATVLSARTGSAVLLKGGHLNQDEIVDVLCINPGEPLIVYRHPRLQTTNTHGTGCTLSSAIAAFCARGLSLEQAVASALAYVCDALEVGLDLGKGTGPIDHLCWQGATISRQIVGQIEA